MKLSNKSSVFKVLTMRDRVSKALKSCKEIQKRLEELEIEQKVFDEPEMESLIGSGIGYSIHLHSYSDGSGEGVNMDGCYVGKEMVEATVDVLEKQHRAIDNWLTEHGVDVTN